MVFREKVLYAKTLGGRTISVQVENTQKGQVRLRDKRWYRRWWAWCLWVVLAILIALFAAGLWAWTQRYALIENVLIDKLAEEGFQADLNVVSVTRTQARVKDIRLRREGQDFLRVESLQASYVWPDVRDLQLKRLELDGATGQFALGADWRPTDSWVNDLFIKGQGLGTDDKAAKVKFPENGIGLTDVSLNLSSPMGKATLYIDADIPAEDRFTSEITLAPSDLSYGGFAAQGAGVVTLEREGSLIRIVGQTQTETLSNMQMEMQKADLQIDGSYDTEEKSYLGSVSLDSAQIVSDLFASGPARLAWDGEVFTADALKANGTWSISAENARSPRPVRAMEVAETLSLYPALSLVPVTEYYAPALRKTVRDFILGSDVAGQGRLDFGPDGFKIDPVGSLRVKTKTNQLILTARDQRTFYQFNKADKVIRAQMNAKFNHPVALNMQDIDLRASSVNGVRLDSISTFSAKLQTSANWGALDAEGRPVRLGPLNASLRYGAEMSPRRLSIDTALDYDGYLPGGRVEGLNLDGRLDVRLYDNRQELDFIPRPNTQITLASLETPTNWIGETISFNLPATEKLFMRTASKSVLSAALEQADFILTQPATSETEAQRLDIQSAELTLEGVLWKDKTQDWIVDLSELRYATETLPGPGTTATSPLARVTARLEPEQTPQITLNSASVTAETPLARLSNFEIALSGTPDDYVVEHTGGTVDVIGSEFAAAAASAGVARFPANGRVHYKDGRFVGQAKLVVAKADNADVSVSYEYGDGAGVADIDIPSILFKPKGLQPQTLVPAFRGKIARVEGEARAKLNIGFADGALTTSSGTVQLVDMAVGTAPGPVTGLNTTLRFASLWPLQTDGPQQMTLESFNPGLPLEDGRVSFTLVPDGVEVYSADWPIGNGAFSLDPFTWLYAAEENRVTMRVKNVALGDFLNDLGNRKIEATGNVVGVFPIVIRGIEVLVENGAVSVPEGGLIKYDPGPNVLNYTEEQAIAILRERRSSEYAALAQDALREFRYRELSASLDGPLDGDVEIGLVFDGSNEKVLNRQPFRFDITVKGELFNIARSFNSNAQVKSEILRQNGQLPEGTVIGE